MLAAPDPMLLAPCPRAPFLNLSLLPLAPLHTRNLGRAVVIRHVAKSTSSLGLATPLMMLAHVANTQPQLDSLPTKAVHVSSLAVILVLCLQLGCSVLPAKAAHVSLVSCFQ